MFDHLLLSKVHVGLDTELDRLLSPGPLTNIAKNYLIACKVEGKARGTINVYSVAISRLLDFTNTTDIPSADVRLFLLSLQESKRKPSTVHMYYRSLKTFFNWCVNEGYLEKSPMANIKPPKLPKLIVKPFSSTDIDNILLQCSGNRFVDIRNRAIVLLFLDTGLRLAELSNIQLKDIDFDKEIIRVFGKGSKERIVRFGRIAQKALIKYLLTRKDNLPCLWVTHDTHPMNKAGVQTVIKRICRRAGVKDVRPGPHTFRHTFATRSLINGAGEFEVQSLLGHESLTITRRYSATLRSEHAVEGHKRFSPVDNMGLK